MKITKYRVIIAAIVLAGIAVTGFAQVDRDELQDLPPVVFINYEGPHARLDTREEIRQIGVVLGQQVSIRERGNASAQAGMTAEERRRFTDRYETGAQNRYFIIHCVSAPEGSKLDADILGLGVDAGVDHIRNLRVIIQGYLQAAYNYSERDAALLAEYITIYNAVYRGNWDYFVERYKTQVIGNLTSDKVGLSIRYDEWPGRTLIVIPLGHGAVDTSAITDSRVIEEMRKEDDQGLPQRREMVDLIERQAEQAERQAQQERQQVQQEERQVAQERTQTEQERQRVQEDQQQGRITQEEAIRRQDELDQKDEELDRREAALEERREEADRLDEYAGQMSDDAQRQREEIARDQQSIIVQETTGGVFGVTIERTAPTEMGRIVRLNSANGQVLRRSPLDTTHTRTVTFIGGRILAIAGEAREQGAVRLVEINQSSLEMAKQGDDDIKTGSLLWVNGGDLYAITESGGNCYLGRFNTNLELQAKSQVQVHPDCGLTIQQGRLLTQRPDGSAMALNPMDLTEVR
ncbi:MAG: hypothetical protein FWC22_02470 [Treponema sp.]|nr:hypothetical protein [Treponema sp.]